MFFLEHDQTSLEIDETTSKGHMKLRVSVNLTNKRVELSLFQSHGESSLTLTLSQYKLLMESMKVFKVNHIIVRSIYCDRMVNTTLIYKPYRIQ